MTFKFHACAVLKSNTLIARLCSSQITSLKWFCLQ